MQADGTVLINTKIQTDGIEIGAENIERTLNESAKVIYGYDKTVQEWVDKYVEEMNGASKTNNEFKREIESIKKELENLESKGLYFGDEEYDNAYLKFAQLQQALKDYKQELVRPTSDVRSFDSSTLEGQIEKLSDELVKLREKGKGFGDELFDSTYKSLSQAQEKLKEYKKELARKEEPIQLDTSTMEGQINLLKVKLEGLRNQGKGFGDSEFDATALALKRAEQALNEYKNELFKTDAQREKEAETAKKQAEKQEQLNKKIEETERKEKEAADEAHRLAEIGKNAKISSPYIVALSKELDRLVARRKDLQKAGLGVGYKEYDEVTAKINKINEALKKYQIRTDKAEKKTKKFSSGLDKTSKSANKAQRGIGRMLVTSLLFSTVFRAISAVSSGLKEGMDNLAQYSDNTNRALSFLMSSMTQLKNAFATAFSPLIEIAAPALAQFINLLAEAVTWTAQLLAALTGKDTFVRAVEVQQDYAESLDKTKDETEDAAKATEKAIAPFDKLIQITSEKNNKTENSTDTELKPEQMFTTEEVSNQIKTQAEAIKNTLGELFAPLKQSWLENGPQVMDSLKNTFSAIKQLAKDIGSSFMQVWNTEGYGKAITDDLLITFSNLVDTVGNLATNFDKAWVSGETGTNILRHIGDIILEITGFFREASQSLKEWSENIDFSPLLESFDRVLVAIRPIVSDVGDLLLWLLNNVLLPLASWGIEQALPTVFDLIAAALDTLHSVIEALEPLGLWLWENFLKPLGEWTGGVIISTLQAITDGLRAFSDWINNNQGIVQVGAVTIAAFFAAWKTVEILSFIQQSGGVISALKRITDAVAGSTIAKIKDLAETAALNAMYAGDFVVSVGKAIASLGKMTAAKAADLAETVALKAMYAGDFVASIAKATVEAVKHTASLVKMTAAKWSEIAAQKALSLVTQAWSGICTLAQNATALLSSKMGILALEISAVVAIFQIIYKLASLVSQAWDKMTPGEQLATKIIAVAGAIALVVALIAAAAKQWDTVMIAGAIAAIAGLTIYGIATAANNRASGSRSGYSAATYAAVPYQLPRLATGTVIPPRAGEFAAILGDNKRETEVVSPLSTMKKALKEVLVESGFAGGERDIHIDLILDGQRFARAVYKANNQEQQRVGVRMVTNG